MNGRILKLEVPEHQAVQELLAWHASARLAPDEAQRVARHVQSCAQCRQDLQWERELLDLVRCEPHAAEEADISAALSRLLPRLGQQEAAPVTEGQRERAAAGSAPAPLLAAPAAGMALRAGSGPATAAPVPAGAAGSPWWRKLAANEASSLRWAALAQCLIIAALALLLARPEPQAASYRAMGASDTSGAATGAGNVVVIFAPGISEQDLRRTLQAQDARIVDGPTVTGAYVLSIPAEGRSQALHALRASTAVQLAEPLDAGAAP